MDIVPIKMKNDDSVQKLIDKTARKLQNKYFKKRKINENFLKHKNKGMEIVSRVLSVVCILVVVFSALFFASIVNSYLQGVPSSFAGFTSMKVASESMVASGFNKGDNVIAKSVNTKTLKEECIIAFYRDWSVSKTFDLAKAEVVDTTGIGEPEYQITFAKFFGTQNDAIKKASKSNYNIIFHKIYEVYEIDGVRWFQTYGSSNFNLDGTQQIDKWYVREDLVVGVYDDSFTAQCISNVLQVFSSSQRIIIALIIPLVIFGIIVFIQFLRDIQLLKLQLDVIEEKRKINDPICVKYEVGYHMDNKMKYKVLAQADDENKNEYISYLWKDGKAPENIRKYCLRKKMYLKPLEKLLNINRICQEKLNNGENPKDVAKYYLKEKKALQKEQLAFERKFRKWLKEDKINWVSDDELEYDDNEDKLNISQNKSSNQDEQIVEEIAGNKIKTENEIANESAEFEINYDDKKSNQVDNVPNGTFEVQSESNEKVVKVAKRKTNLKDEKVGHKTRKTNKKVDNKGNLKVKSKKTNKD